MAPVFGLLIVVGVEVDIVEYDSVGSNQVDAQTACLGGQQEDEDTRVIREAI